MAGPGGKVRPFDPRTDLHRVIGFHVDLIESNFPARGMMDGTQYDVELREEAFKLDGDFRKSIENADMRTNGIFVWEDGGRLVGYLWVALRQEPHLHVPAGVIREIFVVPDRRGTGLAAKIMNYALDWFRMHGARIQRLDVTASNESAVKLYEKFGFRVFRYEMERLEED